MKKRTSNIILIAGGLLGAVLLLKQFAGGIAINFKGLKWLGFEGLRLRFAMFYDVTNSNDITATISSLKGIVSYGNYKLSDVVIDKPVDIMSGGTEAIEVRFSVSPGTLVGELTRFFEEKSGFKKFLLKGVLSGSVGKLPFRLPLNEKLGLAE